MQLNNPFFVASGQKLPLYRKHFLRRTRVENLAAGSLANPTRSRDPTRH
jgi:hypothetical protein